MENQDTTRIVAVVDANEAHRGKVCKVLMSHYDIRPFGDTRAAMDNFAADKPLLILLNAETKPASAPDFIQDIRANSQLSDIKIVCVINSDTDALKEDVMSAGADGYIVKPYSPSMLINTISERLNANIEERWEALPITPRQALKQSVDVFHQIADVLTGDGAVPFTEIKDNCQPLVSAIEDNDFLSILNGVRDHDDYTYAHSMRVATLLTLLGHAAGFKNDEQLLLASGGLLHDVGKMKIPHNILNKPGRLDEAEFEIMKSHVPETIDYLKKCENIPKAVLVIAEQHHEKIDGTGYPNGLKGKELNELARMAAIVDVFSALTDRRIYKDPMSPDKAMTIMRDEMSSHLDKHFVKMFRGVLIDTGVLI